LKDNKNWKKSGEAMKKTNLFMFLAGVAGVIVGLIFFRIYFSLNPGVYEKEISKKVSENCPQSPGSKILPAPKFSKKMPADLVTNYQGEATIMWEEVPYAYRYYVRVYNAKGKLIRKWKTKYDVVYVKDLPFDKSKEYTTHQITLSSVNYLEQDGPESEKKSIKTRRLSNLLAPAIESVIIED
jgi:hypothetical protein